VMKVTRLEKEYHAQTTPHSYKPKKTKEAIGPLLLEGP